MLTARRVTCRCAVFGLMVCILAGCSATAYRTSDVHPPLKKGLATLVLPDLTSLKVFSIDGTEGPNKAGSPFSDESENGSRSSGAVRVKLLPGKHILNIAYYQRIPGKIGAIKYLPPAKTLQFVAEEGRTYTIQVQVSGDRWEPSVIEVDDESGQK